MKIAHPQQDSDPQQHLSAALESLTRLDTEDGPAAWRLLVSWVLARKSSLTEADRFQATRLADAARGRVNHACQELEAGQTMTAVTHLAVLNSIAAQLADWIASIREPLDQPLRETIVNGLRLLSHHNKALKPVIASICLERDVVQQQAPPDPISHAPTLALQDHESVAREETASAVGSGTEREGPERKVGRPATVHRIVSRIAELKEGRMRWPAITSQISTEFKYEYAVATLKSYWRDRRAYLTQAT